MSSRSDPGQPAAARNRWFRVLAPVLVLLVGGMAAVALLQSGPSAKREPSKPQARLVETRPVEIGRARTRIDAMGTVVPSKSVTLRPQVVGEIVFVSENLVPGGLFRTGDELLRIDPRDYELAILQRESEVAQALSTLRLEQGQQTIAKREFELLNESLQDDDRELVLRKPQLESVRAQLALARARLEQARLDLQRSQVLANAAGGGGDLFQVRHRFEAALPLFVAVTDGQIGLDALAAPEIGRIHRQGVKNVRPRVIGK